MNPTEMNRGDVVKIGRTQWIVFIVEDNFSSYVYKWPSKKKKIYKMQMMNRAGDYAVWEAGGEGQRLTTNLIEGKPQVTKRLEEGTW